MWEIIWEIDYLRDYRARLISSSWVNLSLYLPHYHLIFVLSLRRPTLICNKSSNKQRLMKQININKCNFYRFILHYAEPLVLHSEIYTNELHARLTAAWLYAKPLVYRALKSTRKSDTNRRLHHAEPLAPHAEISSTWSWSRDSSRGVWCCDQN